MPRRRAQRGVRAPYTFSKLKDDIQAMRGLNGARKSLRKISAGYGVSHAVIQRILAGEEPKAADIRHRLGLPVLEPAPVCTKCGQVHVTKRCTANHKRQTAKRRNWKGLALFLAGLLATNNAPNLKSRARVGR